MENRSTQDRQLLREQGFTFVEMLMTVLIGAALIIGSSLVIRRLSKSTKNKNDKSYHQSGSFAKYFGQWIKEAGVSRVFLNFPVKVMACTDREPCLREKTEGADFTSLQQNPLPQQPSSVQFFSDAYGRYSLVQDYPSQVGWNTIAQKAMALPSELVKNEATVSSLYVTWPLLDEESPRWLALSKLKEMPGQFGFSNFFGTLADAQTQKKEFLLAVDAPASDWGLLKDQLVLFYNSYAPKEYMVWKIDRVQSCVQSQDACQGWLSQQGWADLPPDWSNGKLGEKPWERLVLVAVSEIDARDPILHREDPFLNQRKVPALPPFLPHLQLGITPLEKWSQADAVIHPQDQEDFYLFPIRYPSFYFSKAKLDRAPPTSDEVRSLRPIDLRRLTKLYSIARARSRDQEGMDPELKWVGLPVQLHAFYLRADASDPGSFQLVKSVYVPGDKKRSHEFVVVAKGIRQGVTIARKLGSNEIGLYFKDEVKPIEVGSE